jgi:multidrug efflux pump subunit AcrA (membrane-fusion protein)
VVAHAREDVFQGYAEGEFVRVAAPFAGSLQNLQVKRGTLVKAGDPLFTLEQVNEAAARREAEEHARNAAYGKLLITGTAAEVIVHSKLSTWAVIGPELFGLAVELKNVPAITMVVPFGTTLDVSGTDEAALEAALTPFRARPHTGVDSRPTEPGRRVHPHDG